MSKLLIVDDQPGIRFSIAQVFAGKDVQIFEADSGPQALQLAVEEPPDVVLLDIRLGKQSGMDVFHDLRQIDPKCLIVFITGYSSAEMAIEAMKLGAYDYLVKPLDVSQLQQVVEQAFTISRMMHVAAIMDSSDKPGEAVERLVGSGPAMRSACKQIGRVAPQDVNVLVFGESGTGKELVARAIYHHRRRNQAPFLAINCAAIPETLLESELFGHECGTFTGAHRRRIGTFEQIHGGTLFLDEVGDMSLSTQAKILRLLQEQRFERLGGNESVTVDVRVIAATNHDLDSAIREGRFRKDLYYRLRGVTINLPALRERREDIAELAHYFLFRYNRQLNKVVQSISPAALELLEKYAWPGNVRELQSVIWESLITSAGITILPECLPPVLQQQASTLPADAEAGDLPLGEVNWGVLPQIIESSLASQRTDVYRLTREQFDRLLLFRTLQHTGGNHTRAAVILGLSRVTLRAKLRTMRDSLLVRAEPIGASRICPRALPSYDCRS